MDRQIQHDIHTRWIEQLRADLPEGVPTRGDPEQMWPATFGDMVDGKPEHRLGDGEGYCFQCLHCRNYVPLEFPLGMDWGACVKEGGQYERQAVFEHWTCKDYEGGDIEP
jgi:hypothetical protein